MQVIGMIFSVLGWVVFAFGVVLALVPFGIVGAIPFLFIGAIGIGLGWLLRKLARRNLLNRHAGN